MTLGKNGDGLQDVQMVELPFMVATQATDGKWYVRAAFAVKPLADAYAKGMSVGGIQAKVIWGDPEGA